MEECADVSCCPQILSDPKDRFVIMLSCLVYLGCVVFETKKEKSILCVCVKRLTQVIGVLGNFMGKVK